MSKKVLIGLSVLLIVIAAAVGTALVVTHLNSEKQAAGEDVGEIYYQVTPEEHIASTEIGTMYADNELLVVAKDGVKKSKIEKLAKKYGAEIVGYIEATGDYQWSFNNEYTMSEMEDLIAAITSEDLILEASPNYIFNLCETSVDHDINTGKKWKGDLKNATDNKGKSWGVEAIKAPAAWALMDENKDKIDPVCVGVIDAGFDDTHKDLPFLQIFYNDAYKTAGKGKKKEIGGHGTHVTGTFAANGNNDEGICGVYPYAEEGGLFAASWKNFKQYSENNTSLIWEKVCFAELILRNVKVINCSYGEETLGAELEYYRNVLQDNSKVDEKEQAISEQGKVFGSFLERFIQKGYDFLVVVSAGNASNKDFKLEIEEQEIDYRTGDVPARVNSSATFVTRENNAQAYSRIIVVGAMDKNYNRCSFSNNGDRVDIYAPGSNIYSTVPVNSYENGETWSGTSMAAPHVAGVAASVWSINNNLSGPQIKALVCSSTDLDHSDLPIIDMASAVRVALRTRDTITSDEETTQPDQGSIMGFVVDKDDYSVSADNGIESGAIEAAEIKAVNKESKQETVVKTDYSGHFELILPPGEYTLTVTAEGYEPYHWSGTFKVKAGQVNYLKELDDWIKMTKLKETTTDAVTTVVPNTTETSMEKETEKVQVKNLSLNYEMKEAYFEHRTSDGVLFFTDKIEYPYFKGNSSLEKTLNAKYSKKVQSYKSFDGDIDEYYQSAKDCESEYYQLSSLLPFYVNEFSEVTYNKNGYISIEEYLVDWQGGAHPYTYPSAETYNIETGKKLEYSDFFIGKESAVLNYLRPKFKEAGAYEEQIANNSSFKDLLAETPFSLTSKGLCFHYYAGGAVPNVEVIIPYTESMEPFIKVGS